MSDQIQQMERENESYREQVAMGEVATRLKDNKDFKSFILEYFCTKECARYAQVSGDVSLPEDSRKDALANAQAAGYLKRFINNSIQMGNSAATAIKENEAEIEHLRTKVNTAE